MRIADHPILGFERGRAVRFTFDGRELTGYDGEIIAAALHAAGIRVLSESHGLHRPRGFFCAIGNCSSCLMVVDGEPNTRVCVERLREGMRVETQHGKGVLGAGVDRATNVPRPEPS
jgi:predicted molibdopterin-dependent oxidoreductase YjgC